MRREIPLLWAAFTCLVAAACTAPAQYASGSEWDPAAHDLGRPPASSASPSNPPLEALNRILSASQLSAIDRSVYLSIRAFQFSRLGREADSQKDVAEMGKLLPNAWQVILSSTQPELAGGGDRAAALRTLDYGLQRKPGDPWLFVAQAQVHMQLADFPQALILLDQAVASASGEAERRAALYYRGQANLNLGNFSPAVEDFDGTLKSLTNLNARLGPLLWRFAAQTHTRQDARSNLTKDVGSEPLVDWPGPIAQFLMGKISPGALEIAAESDEAAKRNNGKCPAAYYVAMEAIRRGEKQQAREQFQLAQARCPTVSPYNWAASSELKRL